MPRDLIEGDHVIPFSDGGTTTLDNLQALCVACNRRKGNRPVPLHEPMPPSVGGATTPLRRWQVQALEVVMGTRDPVLIEACPGSGKTLMALEAAARLIASGEINRVLVVVPTRHLVKQWVDVAKGAGGGPTVPLAPPGWRPTRPLYEPWCGAVFTYQALVTQTTMLAALAAEPGYRTLVIFDEVHHAGSDSPWGVSAQQAFTAAATRIVSLSGTPFRTADPIVFVRTADGRSVPDYRYRYGDALDDGTCRPVRFAHVGGTATFQVPSGEVHTVSFEDDLNEQGESYRLRTVLEAGGGHLNTMLAYADAHLHGLRVAGDHDAAGLVVCMDCDHADRIAELLRVRLGARPVVACSRLNSPDDPAPGPAISGFTTGTAPWIVAVRMVSEGVDIRRLRVLVYATNVVTDLSFRQIIGRVVRTDTANAPDDAGLVVLPADPRLVAMAEQIRDEAPTRIAAPIVIDEGQPGRTTIELHGERGEFVPLDSTGDIDHIADTSGRIVEAGLLAAAQRYAAATGSPIPPFELAVAASGNPGLRAELLRF
jgi:superfamily II DNA or RNA helicase